MSKKMLIDATHPEETRVVVSENGRVEELDVDTSTKKQIKGNIYLAKIVRVEPSLQAAFVDYGGNKHGFLAFGEIHPDYYQIPVADREALKEIMAKHHEEEAEELDNIAMQNASKKADVEVVSESEGEETSRHRPSFIKRYKIQEVIRQGQVMLVQVVKEERGNKGAALTTYLSLAGRFSVLMPNNGRGGGISRKITNAKDRKALRTIIDKFAIPQGMSVIIRTAGQGKTKTEIKRDYDYLIKTWTKIRSDTLESLAPKLIHEEGDIIKRSLRDVFTPDIEEIWVEGESVFKSTKDFMKMLMPAQAKKIKQYKGTEPLFTAYQVEQQLESIHSNIVQLKSGGYLVIDQTEALVAVDVNSGRATREHDIEETALRTNLETCDELARQLRLRDMAGLIVIDFIDMDEPKNNAAIERRLKEALKRDRARIQVGRMSGFGLMEMSRQRLHSSFLESSYQPCVHCGGKGMIRSVESCAMHALHILEEACFKNVGNRILISLPLHVATYLLNNKRSHLADLEKKYKVILQVIPDETLVRSSDFKLERIREDGERVNVNLTPAPVFAETKETKKQEQPVRKENRSEEKRVQKEVAETVKEEQEDALETENTEENSDRKSRNIRRRNEWRRKRKEKRMLARLRKAQQDGKTEAPAVVEVDTTPADMVAGEEHFTVVEQEEITSFNAHTQESAQEMQEETVQEKLPKSKRPYPKKKKAKSDRKEKGVKAKTVPETEQAVVAEPVVEKEVAKKTTRTKKTEKAEKTEKPVKTAKTPKASKSSREEKPAEAEKKADSHPVETTPQESEQTPKKAKKGWWNKLVKPEE